MNGRTVLLGALISISLSLSAYSALAYNVGDVVEIQPSMMKNPAMGMWYRGKVTATKNGGLTVVADDGTEYLMVIDPRWIRTAAPVAQGSVPGSGVGFGAVSAAGAGRSSTGATTSGAFGPSGSSSRTYKVGDVVEVQASMRTDPSKGLWSRGKVTALRKNGGLTVLGDDGSEFLIWTDPPIWIRPASPSSKGSTSGSAAGTSRSSTGISASGASIPTGNSTRANIGSAKANSSAGSASTVLPAKGSPPDGEYNCMKISGSSLIHLGTLEIRGGTYRGLSKAGGFSPMIVSGGGNITWSQGLRGMPEGWKVTDSRYVGGDEHGRPLIKIYYRSGSGWNEVMDALKEH